MAGPLEARDQPVRRHRLPAGVDLEAIGIDGRVGEGLEDLPEGLVVLGGREHRDRHAISMLILVCLKGPLGTVKAECLLDMEGHCAEFAPRSPHHEDRPVPF